MSDYQKTPFKRRPSIIFNDYRQPLPETIAPINGGKYPATANWEISGDRDKVYFKVNDGIFGAQDQNAKLKSVEMGWCERNALFALLDRAASDKEFTASQMAVYDKSFSGGDRLPLRATFTVLRGNSGEIRLHYRRSTYEAVFVMTNKRLVISKKGENGAWAPSPGLSSALYALSYIEALRDFLNKNEIENHKPKERKDSDGGNNYNGSNGYGNNNSYGNNGYNGSNGSGGNGNGSGSGDSNLTIEDDFDADLNF